MAEWVLPAREERIARLANGSFDVLVVGGGITGAGVALELAERGVRVALVERGDWASGTSSASSRLIHGGLRYLEQFQFGLVRESLHERGALLHDAAGFVWPERFTFPILRGDRVRPWKLGLGLELYDFLAGRRRIERSSRIDVDTARLRIPGVGAELLAAGSYVDGATNDSRLVLATVLSAAAAGAVIASRVEIRSIGTHSPGGVSARATDVESDAPLRILAKRAVLCGGPVTDQLIARTQDGVEGGRRRQRVSATRGSHVLVPRSRLAVDGAVIFPSAIDGRVMFLLSWPRYTAIGTTDLDAPVDAAPRATGAEVDYLLASANALVSGPDLTRSDVVSTWSGLRPLVAAGGRPSARSREELIERQEALVVVAGGKLTTFRATARRVAESLRVRRTKGVHSVPLRGALAAPLERPSWSSLTGLDLDRATRLADAHVRRYGTFATSVRERCAAARDGDTALDAETLLGEVDWAVEHEDCRTPTDFLLRRTDCGYGPRDAVEKIHRIVRERMSRLLSWDAHALARADAEWGEVFERMHAFRDDPASGPALRL